VLNYQIFSYVMSALEDSNNQNNAPITDVINMINSLDEASEIIDQNLSALYKALNHAIFQDRNIIYLLDGGKVMQAIYRKYIAYLVHIEKHEVLSMRALIYSSKLADSASSLTLKNYLQNMDIRQPLARFNLHIIHNGLNKYTDLLKLNSHNLLFGHDLLDIYNQAVHAYTLEHQTKRPSPSLKRKLGDSGKSVTKNLNSFKKPRY